MGCSKCLAGMVLVTAAMFCTPAAGQRRSVAPPPEKEGPRYPTDPKFDRLLDFARDYVEAEKWAEACQALQRAIDAGDKIYVRVRRVSADGKVKVEWVRVRDEANRIIGTFPKDGRDFYKLAYGPAARKLLKQAGKDLGLIRDVADRYPHTTAGREARRKLQEAKKDPTK